MSIKQDMDELIAKIAFDIRNQAVKNCPVDTGTMKRSIRVRKIKDCTYEISVGVEYSKYVEYGTAKMIRAHGVHDPEHPVTNWEAKRKRGGGANQIMPFFRPAIYKVIGEFNNG